MIVLDCKQGSKEWLEARAGVVTASEANSILTPKALEVAKADAYLNQIVAEILLGEPVESATSAYMERGSEMEDEARAYYEYSRGVKCDRVGFVLRDDRRLGCSPDSLIGKDGGAEIKCPGAAGHVGNLLNPEAFLVKHRGQVQVGMLVAERSWYDLISYHPTMPALVIRVTPDKAYLKPFTSALADFLTRVDDALTKIGPVERKKKRGEDFAAITPADAEEAGRLYAEIQALDPARVEAARKSLGFTAPLPLFTLKALRAMSARLADAPF